MFGEDIFDVGVEMRVVLVVVVGVMWWERKGLREEGCFSN